MCRFLLVAVLLVTIVLASQHIALGDGGRPIIFPPWPRKCDSIFNCPPLLQNTPNNSSPQQTQHTHELNSYQTSTPAPASIPTPSSPSPPAPVTPGFSGDPEQHPNRSFFKQHCGAFVTTKPFFGTAVLIGESPWIALLGYEIANTGTLDWRCTGVLISDQYVLTAAHCVTNLPSALRLSTVRLGEIELGKNIMWTYQAPPYQDIAIEEIIAHESYNSPNFFQNDIALLRLANKPDPTVDSSIGTICMPFGEFRTKNFDGQRLTVHSFGLTEPFGGSGGFLRSFDVPAINNTFCAAQFRRLGSVIDDTQICTGSGESERDSCSGDPGGPLFAYSKFGLPVYVVGVTSFGATRCRLEGLPGVYTRVSSYLNWIMDHMRE